MNDHLFLSFNIPLTTQFAPTTSREPHYTWLWVRGKPKCCLRPSGRSLPPPTLINIFNLSEFKSFLTKSFLTTPIMKHANYLVVTKAPFLGHSSPPSLFSRRNEFFIYKFTFMFLYREAFWIHKSPPRKLRLLRYLQAFFFTSNNIIQKKLQAEIEIIWCLKKIEEKEKIYVCVFISPSSIDPPFSIIPPSLSEAHLFMGRQVRKQRKKCKYLLFTRLLNDFALSNHLD